jgi:acyl-CoA thioesterase-1
MMRRSVIRNSRVPLLPLWAAMAFAILTCNLLFGDDARGEKQKVILALGDSLTAGLGVVEAESYPSLLQESLKARGYTHRVINAGVSGDTTAGGLARISWLLQQNPQVVIVALGANDGLRGLPLPQMQANLKAIILKCRESRAHVLLAGMRIPPNYGEEYSREFEAVYAHLAAELHLPFVPFLLEGVAANREYTQPDGIHPLGPGYRIVAQTVWKHLQPLLD